MTAIFNSGTKTIFHQTSAPTGWVKETTNYNDHALRIVNGSSLSSGGSVDFTTVFPTNPYTYTNNSVPYSAGVTTITARQTAAHLHGVTPSVGKFFYGGNFFAQLGPPTPVATLSQPGNTFAGSPNSNTTSGGHDHTVTASISGNFFSNSPNSHIGVNYIDVIIATLS